MLVLKIRSKCLKMLQITLKGFRHLCILKEIYPQQLHGHVPGNKKVQSFYHIKDIRARTMALTIMTKHACVLCEMGEILKNESQQALLAKLHDAEHLLGTEWKGFLCELIKGGLEKVCSFCGSRKSRGSRDQ